jgi:hypothetical protein
MQSINSAWMGRSLDKSRSLALVAMAVLLAASDVIPDNQYVDPDRLEFAIALAIGATALFVGARDRVSAGTMARWGLRLVLLAFTLALLLPLGEFATRVIFREVTTSSDFGGYFSRRWIGAGGGRVNGSGFRERAFSAAKAPGTYRIAVIGDSFTYGNGIRQEDRYSDLMQAHLPDHFEVLNFGQPGANTPEHRHQVEVLLPQIHPDFVLLQWYVNDTEDDDSTGRPTFHPLLPFRGLHGWLSEKSAFYTVANMKWAEMQVLAGMTVSYPEFLQHRRGDPNSHDSQLDRRLLTELIEMCKRAGVPIGIVLFPDTAASMGDDYPFGYLHQRVLDVCTAQNITCLDLRKDFSLVKERQSLWANQLDHHPSARANAIAAEKILETFSKTWAASPAQVTPPVQTR